MSMWCRKGGLWHGQVIACGLYTGIELSCYPFAFGIPIISAVVAKYP